MQHFETSYLSDQSAYSITKTAYEKLQATDRQTPEARELEERLQKWNNASSNMRKFVRNRGSRYEPCTFESFIAETKEQAAVVDSLIQYSKDSKDLITKGKNVLLIGSKGTGKDHLLCALAKRCFMESGNVPSWENGIDLLEQFHRASLQANAWCISDRLEESDILYISDPLPPTGTLSESKQAAMFRLVDYRYSHRKPIWMTLNVADGAEAELRMGAQTVDRLRDGALVLFCNWSSYRKAER
jgi:DNA replication protein DnaC